jgi:hypothetical protein
MNELAHPGTPKGAETLPVAEISNGFTGNSLRAAPL